MTHSLLERKFLWRHISKSRKANNFKFCMFTSIIRAIIGSKFQIYPITVTLFSGSGPKFLESQTFHSFLQAGDFILAENIKFRDCDKRNY